MDVSSIEMGGYMTSKPDDKELWDPGSDPQRTKLIDIALSSPLHALLSMTNTCDRESDESSDDNEGEESMSSMDLDSHANMVVVGRHAYILSDMGRTAEVNLFTLDYKSMQVPIVNAAVQYECPYSGTLHVLIIRNALHVSSMKHNLVPPFMIREEGIQVNDTPKIQVNDPTTSDHSQSIYFPETDFRIPLSLWAVFSYFPSSKPMAQTLKETEEVYLQMPSHWNPHCDSYAQNEENMLDWEGNMVERKDRMQILIDDLPDGAKTVGSTQISSVELARITAIVEARVAKACEEIETPYRAVPVEADEVSAVLSGVSPNVVDAKLLDHLSALRDLGMFQVTIGSTNIPRGTYLVETVDDNDSGSSESSDDESVTTCLRAASEEKSTWMTSW